MTTTERVLFLLKCVLRRLRPLLLHRQKVTCNYVMVAALEDFRLGSFLGEP